MKTKFTSVSYVCPPFASTPHWWRQITNQKCGMLLQMLISAGPSSAYISGGFGSRPNLRSISSNKCSIVDISGETADQSNILSFCCCKRFWKNRATLGLTLSSCNVRLLPWFWMNEITCGWRISSRYLATVKFPITSCNAVLPVAVMPLHTMTLPPANARRSITHGSKNISPG